MEDIRYNDEGFEPILLLVKLLGRMRSTLEYCMMIPNAMNGKLQENGELWWFVYQHVYIVQIRASSKSSYTQHGKSTT